MEAREGDLLETEARVLFDVKGLVHPPSRVIAFIRYFPYETGERTRSGVTYGKVYSLSKRYELLRKRFPQYLVYDTVFDEMLCEVPVQDIKKHHKPIEILRELRNSQRLDTLEGKALQLAKLLRSEANIPWNCIGISGSIAVNLHTPTSDIDLVVYGSENCRKVYAAFNKMLNNRKQFVEAYTEEDFKRLFDFRSKDTAASFEDFVRTESRKVLQGGFMGTDYFMRFVKDWTEIHEKYGDVHYKNIGYAKISATVVDDSEAIFTPCTYKIENGKTIEGVKSELITEIVSFRGRFCEQARVGETIIAQGKLEQVTDDRLNRLYLRILLGNKPSDFMILA